MFYGVSIAIRQRWCTVSKESEREPLRHQLEEATLLIQKECSPIYPMMGKYLQSKDVFKNF